MRNITELMKEKLVSYLCFSPSTTQSSSAPVDVSGDSDGTDIRSISLHSDAARNQDLWVHRLICALGETRCTVFLPPCVALGATGTRGNLLQLEQWDDVYMLTREDRAAAPCVPINNKQATI